jgi:hypothetical protein
MHVSCTEWMGQGQAQGQMRLVPTADAAAAAADADADVVFVVAFAVCRCFCFGYCRWLGREMAEDAISSCGRQRSRRRGQVPALLKRCPVTSIMDDDNNSSQ